MNFIKKLFHIPTVVELGKNNYNALPSRLFESENQDYCWEDYDREMSAKYPIKWFITRTIPRWWSRYVWGHLMLTPLERIVYWFDFHLIHRYHMLSLQQPGKDGYKYGWLDSDKQILYANFNILMNFAQKELRGEMFEGFSQEDIDAATGQELFDHAQFYQTVKDLVRYWTVERQAENEKISELSKQAYEARLDKAEKTRLYELMRQAEAQFDQRETEMLIKLINIRHRMWT